MAKAHTPGDGHSVPAPTTLADGTPIQWQSYSNARKKKVVEDALFILKQNVKGMRPCNDCFRRLPNGRSFDDILDDPNVFISFDPTTRQGLFGATLGKDITITDFSIRVGRWTVAATLVHEFAHVNGAPGTTHQAESTLPCCGFAALHDPNIIGVGDRATDSRYA